MAACGRSISDLIKSLARQFETKRLEPLDNEVPVSRATAILLSTGGKILHRMKSILRRRAKPSHLNKENDS
jgi:hypothetical protein